MKLLLHACCGPCASGVLEPILSEGFDVTLWFFNPNIHPREEYLKRLTGLYQVAQNQGVQVLHDPVNADFYDEIKFLQEAQKREPRCMYCYETRLLRTAKETAERGFDAFSTTLLVSPYQNNDAVKATGELAAAQFGVEFIYRDFRPYFRKGQAAARALGVYMQKYCGCSLSLK